MGGYLINCAPFPPSFFADYFKLSDILLPMLLKKIYESCERWSNRTVHKTFIKNIVGKQHNIMRSMVRKQSMSGRKTVNVREERAWMLPDY